MAMAGEKAVVFKRLRAKLYGYTVLFRRRIVARESTEG